MIDIESIFPSGMIMKNFSSVLYVIATIQIQTGAAIGDGVTRTKTAVRSQMVSLGDGDYVLVSRNGRDLYLQHTRPGGKSEWKVIPNEVTKMNSNELLLKRPSDARKAVATPKVRWPSEKKHGRITEIALARWSRPSLLAVVRVSHGKETDFWCLGFKHVMRSSDEQKQLAPNAFVITKGGPDDRVLALSGNLNPPAITIVIGELSATRPGLIVHGTIAVEWCGFPEYATVGEFKPEYPRD